MGEIERTPEVYEEFGEDERQELVEALKAKWDSVNAKYQKITHLIQLDTTGEFIPPPPLHYTYLYVNIFIFSTFIFTGQIRRKERLESELTQIENDIHKLQRASNVLIKK